MRYATLILIMRTFTHVILIDISMVVLMHSNEIDSSTLWMWMKKMDDI